jgi:hypothetical protein
MTIVMLVALEHALDVPKETTWGPLSNYKWCMHELIAMIGCQLK